MNVKKTIRGITHRAFWVGVGALATIVALQISTGVFFP